MAFGNLLISCRQWLWRMKCFLPHDLVELGLENHSEKDFVGFLGCISRQRASPEILVYCCKKIHLEFACQCADDVSNSPGHRFESIGFQN